jgi:hypothetical protein
MGLRWAEFPEAEFLEMKFPATKFLEAGFVEWWSRRLRGIGG